MTGYENPKNQKIDIIIIIIIIYYALLYYYACFVTYCEYCLLYNSYRVIIHPVYSSVTYTTALRNPLALVLDCIQTIASGC